MKILNVSLHNFASYKTLEFDFQNQGLTLIQGPTGSGKSTLCDAIPWVLFGRTAKGGAVNEVIGWSGDGDTYGTARVEIKGQVWNVFRFRGRANDFYFSKPGEEPTRGKDLNDTQKLLNGIIGLDAEVYISGAYFHEFSQTAQFFTITAKNRRTICEQIVDLSMAKNLQLKSSDKLKSIKEEIREIEGQILTLKSNVDLLHRLQKSENEKAATWEDSHAKTKEYVLRMREKFEASRKKVISNKCSSCGTVLSAPKEIVDDSVNPHIARLAELEVEINPYTGSVKNYLAEVENKKQDIKNLEIKKSVAQTDLLDVEILTDVLIDFRALLIKNTVKDLEHTTNKLLTDHFDAEINIELEVSDADKMDVTVKKDGNMCTYTQLSKGQRQLLKLCFGVSVMQCIEDHHGVKFSQIFFDEALDGCDDKIKLKALQLLRTISLEYESVFVIEHSSAFKEQMDNQYAVELVNGESQICHL